MDAFSLMALAPGSSIDLAEAAAREVLLATRSARYDTLDGLATDPLVEDALNGAGALQLKALIAQGEIVAAGKASPLGRPLSSASVEGASWTADTSAPSVSPGLEVPSGGGLCRDAYNVLLLGGLLNGLVGYRG